MALTNQSVIYPVILFAMLSDYLGWLLETYAITM